MSVYVIKKITSYNVVFDDLTVSPCTIDSEKKKKEKVGHIEMQYAATLFVVPTAIESG